MSLSSWYDLDRTELLEALVYGNEKTFRNQAHVVQSVIKEKFPNEKDEGLRKLLLNRVAKPKDPKIREQVISLYETMGTGRSPEISR